MATTKQGNKQLINDVILTHNDFFNLSDNLVATILHAFDQGYIILIFVLQRLFLFRHGVVLCLCHSVAECVD